jgi:sensor histidine kinase YesM
MEEGKNGNSRKILLINPAFQLSVLGFMAGIAGFVIAIFYGAWFFRKFAMQGRELGLPADHVFFEFLREQSNTMNLIFAITSLLALVGIAVAGLILSHRIAGPLYRLRKHLDAVAAGTTLGDVKFREKDYFPEVADAYNRQIARFRKDDRRESDVA